MKKLIVLLCLLSLLFIVFAGCNNSQIEDKKENTTVEQIAGGETDLPPIPLS